MKNNRKLQKFTVLFGLVFVLTLCLFFPSKADALIGSDDPNNSGGFTVHTEKVDGTINVVAMLFNRLEIGEGNIYGLTITKKLDSPNGTLIYKIKSPGPVPISNLTGRTMGGLSLPNGICAPSKLGYICFEDVTMTLSEQHVNSISIPNATIEACYEHECPENQPAQAQTIQAADMETKSIEDIESDINGLQEQMNTVEELLERAKSIENIINGEKQQETLKQLIETLGQHLNNPDALLETAKAIGDLYGKFNENSTDFSLITGVVDDILKQMSNLVEDNEQYITELEKALNAFETQNESAEDDGALDEKYLALLQRLSEAHESEDEINFTEVKEKLLALKESIISKQAKVKQLEGNGLAFNEKLSTFFTTITTRGKAAAEMQNVEEEQRQAISSELDVAEPHKYIEKQIKNLVLQSDETVVSEDLNHLDTLVTKAFEQLDLLKLPGKLLEEIASLTEKVEATMTGQEENHEAGSFKAIEKKLSELSELANLPEKLATTYNMQPLLNDEKNKFRIAMQERISRWLQLPKIFSGENGNEQFEQLENMFNRIIERIATLGEKIEENIDDLEIDEELQVDEDGNGEESGKPILPGLPILDKIIGGPKESPEDKSSDNQSPKTTQPKSPGSGNKDNTGSKPIPIPVPDTKLIEQIADTLKQGKQTLDSILKVTKSADDNLKSMERTSKDLTTRVLLGRHTIKPLTSADFDTNLSRLERHVNGLEKSVQQLRSSITNADKLLGNDAKSNAELKELQAAIEEVQKIKERLEEIRKTLDTYPNYVVFVNTKKDHVDRVIKKLDTMLN